MTADNRNGVIVLAVLVGVMATMGLQVKACMYRERSDNDAFAERCKRKGGDRVYADGFICVQRDAWVESQR